MTTFSQLVDKMVAEVKRPDLLTEVATYLNQSLRELHAEPQRGNAVFFKENLNEEQLTATSDSLSWTAPRPSVFQNMQAVRFDNVFDQGKQIYPREVTPGRIMQDLSWFYYRAGSTYAFSGFGGSGAKVSIAWYEFTKSLKYFTSGTRPAIYDEDSGWTYAGAYDTNDAQRAIAQTLTSNWILLRWGTLLEEGLRAKVYKRVGDDIRARTSYSLFQTQRQGMYSSEAAAFGG